MVRGRPWTVFTGQAGFHWLGAYDPQQHGSAPIGWHRDFTDARERLRDWVAASGTRLDHDRPIRQTIWPGEPPDDTPDGETLITDRHEDFMPSWIGLGLPQRACRGTATYTEL